MDNIQFIYLYRDGGNHKKWGSVVFPNPDQLDSISVKEQLQRAFLEDGLFIASQIRVPEVFLYAGGGLSFDDHCYHELGSVRPTAERADDMHGRTVNEFLAEVIREAERGWQVFDPYDSEGSLGSLLTSLMS